MRVPLLLAALLMPVIAWLSQRGVFGPDNGTVSDRYPTLLVAAGYAFAIWGLIFLWDVVFAATQLRRRHESNALDRVRPAATAGFALTALWMPTFSAQHFLLALAIIWTALACLAYAAVALSRHHPSLAHHRWTAWAPLSLHAGWLSLAAFLNTAQVIVAYRWLDTGDMLTWSLALFAAAAVLLLVLNARMQGNGVYVLAALWGLAAVYVKQSTSPLPGAVIAAWTALAIAVVLLVQTVWLRVQAARHHHMFAD